MGFFARLVRDGLFLLRLIRTYLRIASIGARSTNLAVDDLERACARFASRSAIRFEGAELTYSELNARAERFAAWAAEAGLKRGEAVAVLLPNRLDYIPLWFGLAKLGVVSALLNYELSGAALAHCLAISGARFAVVDETTETALRDSAGRPLEVWSLGPSKAGSRDLAGVLSATPKARAYRSLRAGMKAADTALLMYTSGTTGLPKAARIAHMRAQLFMRGFLGATGARPSDRIHVSLPLYHATGGLCAAGAALLGGGCVILQREFSAHRFFAEILDERATMFVYVGELCRYLAALPAQAGERGHALRLAFGNGLSPDVWRTLLDRFAIPRVLEFYGSTEGNVSMFNFDGKIGAAGRAPRWLAPFFNFALVRFDAEAEAPARGKDGRCQRARPDEIGELIGRIGTSSRDAFHGYARAAQTRKKVLDDVFAKGDAWFSSGDLMRQDEEGYFFFVDRVGDTFRWKGQNVSTNEVAEEILRVAGVKEAAVYGVRVGDLEGRAGMAALVVDPTFDLAAFGAHLDAALPHYAAPVFLRLEEAIAKTGTFKVRKTALQEEGFDPARVSGALFFRPAGGPFEPLTPDVRAEILAGAVRL